MGTVRVVSEMLEFEIVHEDLGDGWVMARVPAIAGAIAQERSREEADEALVQVVRDLLEVRLAAGVELRPLRKGPRR